jgi:hypothetical protein
LQALLQKREGSGSVPLTNGSGSGRSKNIPDTDAYHALVELRDGAKQVEGANVPDLRVADDLEAAGVEHAAQRLVELVQLVDLAGGAVVPQHPVTQHQLVRGVEARAVVAVVVGVARPQRGDGLARGDVIDSCHALGPRADHFVLKATWLLINDRSARSTLYDHLVVHIQFHIIYHVNFLGFLCKLSVQIYERSLPMRHFTFTITARKKREMYGTLHF